MHVLHRLGGRVGLFDLGGLRVGAQAGADGEGGGHEGQNEGAALGHGKLSVAGVVGAPLLLRQPQRGKTWECGGWRGKTGEVVDRRAAAPLRPVQHWCVTQAGEALLTEPARRHGAGQFSRGDEV